MQTDNYTLKDIQDIPALEKLARAVGCAPHHGALRGVLVDGQYLIASSGTTIVKIHCQNLESYSGRILNPDTGKDLVVLDEKGRPQELNYPDYKAVIDKEFKKVPQFCQTKIDALYDYIEDILKDSNKHTKLAVTLKFPGVNFTCSTLRLSLMFSTLESFEAKSVTVRYTDASSPALFYTDNGHLGVIQPEKVDPKDVEQTNPFVFDSCQEPVVEPKESNRIPAQQIEQPKSKNVQSTLRIDIETYSPVELKTAGLYAYAEHPEFEILLFGYAFNSDPVTVIDLLNFEDIPEEVLSALTDPSVLKTAHNANFERVCLSRYLGKDLPVEQWECTMIRSAMVGLPLSLEAVGKVLNLDKAKMSEGKALIRYFSMPCKSTKKNEGRTRNMPEHDAEKWETYKEYNGRDVEAEREISTKIAFFKIPDLEKQLYCLDQMINDRGVMVDLPFVNNAIRMDAISKDNLTVEASELTNLDNPNSVAQLKSWIAEETGEDVESLTKEAIKTLLKNTDSNEVTRVLQIRQEMAKTSVKKYQAMKSMACSDGRIRGLAQFYGANRTGRWSGRGVQLQNLPQNHLVDLDLARQLVAENDLEMLEMLFGNVPDTLSQLIRTALIPKPGYTFLVADFSAIEARVIAWLAGEKWRLEVFATHGKIYEASASQMFKVPLESIVKGSPLRQKGKVAELALGYQGGPGALTTMGALKMGLTEDELQPLVDAWRAANLNIVRLWKTVGDAAMKAVKESTMVAIQHGISFEGRGNVMYILLPSGRRLSYWKPRIGENRFGSPSLIYEGMDQTTKQWKEMETYGGKLVENIVQAIARDCLAHSMLALDKAGYKIVFHVHDEVIIEAHEGSKIDEVCEIMGRPIAWAKGLPLRADGYSTDYYRKD